MRSVAVVKQLWNNIVYIEGDDRSALRNNDDSDIVCHKKKKALDFRSLLLIKKGHFWAI